MAALTRLKPVQNTRQEYSSQFQDMTDALPCHTYLPVCLWIMDPQRRASKMNTSHGNEVRDIMYLIQTPCYQQGNLCQDPAGNRATQRPPDYHKEMQTAVVWTCLLFIRSGPNHLARHSEKGEEDKADRRRSVKTTSGNGQAWSLPSPRGLGRTEKSGGNQLWNYLWCPNDPRSERICVVRGGVTPISCTQAFFNQEEWSLL